MGRPGRFTLGGVMDKHITVIAVLFLVFGFAITKNLHNIFNKVDIYIASTLYVNSFSVFSHNL